MLDDAVALGHQESVVVRLEDLPHGDLPVCCRTVGLLRTPGAFPLRFLVFSLVSLIIGMLYAIGTRQAWRRLRHRHH